MRRNATCLAIGITAESLRLSNSFDWTMPEEQLLLPLQSRHDVALADLPAQAFAPVLSALEQLMTGALTQLHIYGEPGSGRSLLLSAFAAEAAHRLGQCILLPLRQVVFLPADMLQGLETCPLVVLDDIEAVAGWPEWEEGLFNLYNRMQEQGGRLLVSAATVPTDLPIQLPDLRSRLARASVHALPLPDDSIRQELLQIHASRRDWHLEPELVRYLIERGPRGLGRFTAMLDKLEQRALREKRGITVPLVRAVLG